MKTSSLKWKYRETLISGVVSLVLMAGILALLMITGILFAANMDDRIEATARKSHVFQASLKGDDIQIRSFDGVVTLTGTVSAASHSSLAADTVAGLPGVKRVDNQLQVEGSAMVSE